MSKLNHIYQTIDGYATEAEQGTLLQTVLKRNFIVDTFRIAELGVYKGRGTALWLVELINRGVPFEYHAIDHFQGSKEHKQNINYYQLTLDNLKSFLTPDINLKIHKQPTFIAADFFPNNYFDLVYIDASHDYFNVKQDITTWLPKVKIGGVIAGDDYVQGWPDVIKAVDEIFKDRVNRVAKSQWMVVK
jgi:predicted O-methyltransferase YrrM